MSPHQTQSRKTGTRRSNGSQDIPDSLEEGAPLLGPDALEGIERILGSLGDLVVELHGLLSTAAAQRSTLVPAHAPRIGVARRSPRIIERRRREFRPAEIKTLFVTAPPADADDPTSFYLGNGHTFRCMRAAFARALGPSVPVGDDFLAYFRDQGCWIASLPPRFRKQRGRPSAQAVKIEARFVAGIIRQARPTRVVALKESVGSPTADAAEALHIPPTHVRRLRTPNELWKDPFVSFLIQALSE
jgi:hypothetical protein